ncbi:uncharacterized protein AB675_5402 [Cyphellophora attinorum]|uniref:Uncharacterized protein n=1 Tax=Cyphellophora attinorum TaxID=1664694 RepID=A0A0N1HWP1_9EURO|nr:uncharacterized protein AB675_5402 [Phialophora attinorum]KPI42116.1 hypothetical protein AB675_5402 [Phialophora attinorum]
MPRPSIPSLLAQGTLVSSFTAVGFFFVYTKHCEVHEPLDPATEPLFQSSFYRRYNPHNNFYNSDVIVRRVPLTHIRPDLIEDAQAGGSRLVEHFCGSIWSGWPFMVQRYLHGRGHTGSSLPPPDPEATSSPIINEVAKTSKSAWSRVTSTFSSSASNEAPATPSTAATSKPIQEPEDLWSPKDLAASTYPVGTAITNHFIVLAHTPSYAPNSILVRCGSSPLNNPYSPRDSDGLFEISAHCDFEHGFAEFKLKSIFYNGTDEVRGKGKEDGMGMPKRMWWLHQQYAKLWMEAASGKCRMSNMRSMDKQRQRIREEMKEKEDAKTAAKQ